MSVSRHRLAVAGLCFVLAVTGVIIAQTARPTAGPPTAAMKWVRGRGGWQAAHWEHAHPTHRPALHPVLLAAFIAMASVGALIAFSRSSQEHFDRSDKTSSD
jgi:hypothetical protein